MKIIIFFGPPGAGKGTQANILSSEQKIPHLSTGDMLRLAVKKGDDFGKKLSDIMQSGQLVSDDIIIQVIKSRIQDPDCNDGFLLDGFPRTIVQAEELVKMLDDLNKEVSHIFNIVVEDEELKNRIKNRYDEALKAGEEPRKDDNPESFAKRLEVYNKQTAPVLAYFQENMSDKLFNLDGMQDIDKVRSDILANL